MCKIAKLIRALRITAFLSMLGLTLMIISCGGNSKNETDDEVICACGCEVREAEMMGLLEGSWISTGVTRDGEEPVEFLAAVIKLIFTIDEGECASNLYSVSGGECLLPDATEKPFSFVENTNFLRLNLGAVIAIIASLSDEELVLVVNYRECEDSGGRDIGVREYDITFARL